jgi:hypothetical protein
MLKQHEADVLFSISNFVNPRLLCYAEKIKTPIVFLYDF